MVDSLTMQKLVFANQTHNIELRNKIEEMGKRERFLDKAPDKYLATTSGMDFDSFGIYMTFRKQYAWVKSQVSEGECKLQIHGSDVPCDYRVFIVLRTLMDVGITKSRVCAQACRELFIAIYKDMTEEGITIDSTVNALKYGGDYYKNEIIRAIVDSMFSPPEQVKVYLKQELGDDYQDSYYELLGSPYDYDALTEVLKKTYRMACNDQEFHVKRSQGRLLNSLRYLRREQDD